MLIVAITSDMFPAATNLSNSSHGKGASVFHNLYGRKRRKGCMKGVCACACACACVSV